MKLKVLRKDELKKSIAVVVGTRPGIIKFAPVIKQLEKRRKDFFIIHTGQHYSYNMDRQFFEDLDLPEPKYKNDKVKDCKLHGEQTAEMIKGVERALINEKPSLVIVGGDANTNLAAALATRKLGIRLAHMEAGLRSNDWDMPEEHNRIMIDHISEILLTPTERTKNNLLVDNVKGQITVVGNTIVDAVREHIKIAAQKSNLLEELTLDPKKYFLLTFHREENVDSEQRLEDIVITTQKVVEEFPFPIIFPAHPRTLQRLEHFGFMNRLKATPGLMVINAVGYLDFLQLVSNSLLVLTDSGGIQEEACILNIPCVTLRNNTERPETVEVGGNIVATTNHEKVLKAIRYFLDENQKHDWPNPFGENCAEKIIDVLVSHL